MLAVVQNPDAARLMGINVPVAICAAYALSALFAVVATARMAAKNRASRAIPAALILF